MIHRKQKFEEIEALIKAHGQFVLSDDDNAEYRLMALLINEIANVLKLVQETLRPTSFDEFVKNGLA